MNNSYIPPSMEKGRKVKIQIETKDVTVKSFAPIKPLDTFKGLMINERILNNMEKRKITVPTQVQMYALPLALKQTDLLVRAPTGMGKTLAFLIPALTSINTRFSSWGRMRKSKNPRVLILTPTRELAIQIYEDAKMLTADMDITPIVIYGGSGNMREQERMLKKGGDILIGTPGRLQDFISKGMVTFESIEVLIFDEADRMLDMGFEKQIRVLLELLPKEKKRQTMMFSATFPKSVQQMAKEFFQETPSEVYIGDGPRENIAQEVIQLDTSDANFSVRNAKLLQLLSELGYKQSSPIKQTSFVSSLSKVPTLVWQRKGVPAASEQKKAMESSESLKKNPKVIVFLEKKRQCADLLNFLHDKGIPCVSVHGDKTQEEREDAMRKFKTSEIPVMVATSVIGRGLDIPGIELVVNYTLPSDIKDYVHRIGRTGRAGNSGRSIIFISPSNNTHQVHQLVSILKKANQPVPEFLENFSSFRADSRPRRSSGASSSGTGAFARKKDENSSMYKAQTMNEAKKSAESVCIDKIEENLSWDNEIA